LADRGRGGRGEQPAVAEGVDDHPVHAVGRVLGRSLEVGPGGHCPVDEAVHVRHLCRQADPCELSRLRWGHPAAGAGVGKVDHAAGHLDLLTTVAHEMGHVLGLDDTTAASTAHDLMFIDLVDGERRLPDAADVPVTNTTPLTPNIALGPVVTSEMELSSAPVVTGTPGNDTIDAGHGGKTLVGGAGADNFVFANVEIHAATPWSLMSALWGGAPPVTRSGRLASSTSSRAMLFSSSRIWSVLSRYAATTAS